LVMFCVNRVRMEQFDLKNEIDLRSKLDSIRTDSTEQEGLKKIYNIIDTISLVLIVYAM
jgi:hypothetical protein